MSRPTDADKARNWGPAGVPLGRALITRPGIANDDLREAVSAIERVHGDGVLPAIPVTTVQILVNLEGRRLDGRFLYDIADDGIIAPIAIQTRSGALQRRLVALHEAGHFLDACGLRRPGFASGDPEVAVLDQWREAVGSSRAVQTLISLAVSNNLDYRRRAQVLVQSKELWARSYAQFVAAQSGVPSLRTELDTVRREDGVSTVYCPRQWDVDDFSPIASAIEALFRVLGWMDSR